MSVQLLAEVLYSVTFNTMPPSKAKTNTTDKINVLKLIFSKILVVSCCFLMPIQTKQAIEQVNCRESDFKVSCLLNTFVHVFVQVCMQVRISSIRCSADLRQIFIILKFFAKIYYLRLSSYDCFI